MRLLLLQLQTLLGRDYVGDSRLDLLEVLDLLVIGVVEGLGRILGVVEQMGDLGLRQR